MKRFISMLMVVLLVCMTVGCSSDTPTEQKPAESNAGETKTDTPATAEKFPTRPIELVACYGPGGGHDIMLRTMLKVIMDDKLTDATMNVVNKEGGSGFVGMGYVNGHAGDGHYLMCTTSSFLTTPLSTKTDITYKDFTPIALLGLDPSIVVVKADSGINSLEDLFKKDQLTAGGTGQGTIDHIVVTKLAQAANADVNYVPYQGDGDLVTALLGGQVDFISSNPSTTLDYINNGDFKAIAITTPERAEFLPDVQTAIEQGYDVEISLFRGVVCPKDVPENVKEFYWDLLDKLNESEAWKKDYIEANCIVQDYRKGDDFKAFLDELNGVYETTLNELGINN